ncbi:Ubiquinone biosynthesis protein coq9, mitochondrial [Elasticomyces elasticus]|nr:Ubiquinone biosynthesis protein coq9, mitochondrial [Elasticomyces elasticus]
MPPRPPRPLSTHLILHPRRTLPYNPLRPYHSYEETPPPLCPPAQTAILSAALLHVPALGFTNAALAQGARDAGYRDVSVNLFPRGVLEVAMFYCARERVGLGERVDFAGGEGARGERGQGQGLGVGAKVRMLVLERLRVNVETGVVGRWQEALALMAQPSHVPASLAELARLADEIWFLAGDASVDSSWYTKRASLASIYAATELFQTQDQSSAFRDTEHFLERRLEELRVVGGGVRDVVEWVGFTGHGFVNLLRSKGVRI